MRSLSHQRHLGRIIAILLGVAVAAAVCIGLLSHFGQTSGNTINTVYAQQKTYLMHDGDTLDSIVTVPEGTYLVVKSDQGNHDANVQVTGKGGFVVEKGGVLALENVNFSGDDKDRSTPVFSVFGDMVMNDGEVVNFSSTSEGTSSDYGNGGIPAICVVDGTFTMNGGTISGNSNTTTEELAFGGALRAEGEDASVIINDGTLSGNIVLSSASVPDDSTVTANALGGAIAVTEGASVTINGGEISDNTAGSHEANAEGADNLICSGNGGAIAVYSSSSDAVSSLYLDGGSIENNNAYRTGADNGAGATAENETHGGGIFSNVYTTAVLTSGTISGNTSDDKGGGVFLDSDKSCGGASFKNTLVTGNEAESLGGGLWFCPNGEADMFSEAKADGIAVFGNTTAERGTDGAGDDIYVSPRSGDTGVTVSSTMLGGGSNEWYQDGGAATQKTSDNSSRYSSSGTVKTAALDTAETATTRTEETSDLSTAETATQDTAENDSTGTSETATLLTASAVTNQPSEEAADNAEESAEVVITDNTSTCGGGIGSNHYLSFGTPTTEEEVEQEVPDQPSEPEKISINVNKVWVGDAGTEATVHLLADGEEAASALLNADNNWTYTFTNLDQFNSDGTEISYTLIEDSIDGYTSEVSGDASSGFTVTNTKKISIPVTKTWIGDKGSSATVHLLADGEEVASATLNSNNDWKYIFTDLDQANSEGTTINYTLTEDEIDGYTSEVTGNESSGFTVTNTKNEPEKTSVTVTKKWVGGEGSSATVHLLADGKEVASATLNEDNNWSYTFTDLDQSDSDGTTIDYTLTEDSIDGYTSEVSGDASSGFTVTNTKNEPEKTSVTVTKKWVGGEGTSATVHLLADGTEVASATLNADNDWAHTFTDLDKTDTDGKTITYTIKEDKVAGYTSSITGSTDNGFTVTNTKYEPEPEKISIKVTKEWVGGKEASAAVHLLADGEEVASTTLSADNNWTYLFEDLDKTDSSGNNIVYTLIEDAIDGYVSKISGDASSGFTVTNSSNKISIPVTKVWVGDAGSAATVRLNANGTEVANATLTADDNWTHTFTDLDKFDDEGNEIEYTLTEDTIDGYDSEVSGDASSGFTVTNTKKISIPVTKTWVGETGSSATVHLLANGKEVKSATLTEDDNWTYTFTDLPQADSSGTIAYTLTEDDIEGFKGEVTGDAEEGFTVTNTAVVDVPVQKVWLSGGADSLEIVLVIGVKRWRRLS